MNRTRLSPLWLCITVLLGAGGCPILVTGTPTEPNSSSTNNDGVGQSVFDQTIQTLEAEIAALESELSGLDSSFASQVFGDGSAGSRTVGGSEGTLGDSNLQFTDFNVPAGVTIIIQSGATIRCKGSVSIAGTIVVRAGADGGDRNTPSSTTLAESLRPPAGGLSTIAAGAGEAGAAGAQLLAGNGSPGLSEFEARQALILGTIAGGGGGAALSSGGAGGGGLTILAQGSIRVDGSIIADGESASTGGGGGAGGAVILASRDSIAVSDSAQLSASGGKGGDSDGTQGVGGGGGGGIFHFIAPKITADGEVAVAGGAPGALGDNQSVNAEIRAAGGGGGATGGAGGAGGGLDVDGTPLPAEAGGDGFFLLTEVDPTALF